MRIESTRRLRGPNVYLDRPVMVAHLYLEDLGGHETHEMPGFTHTLLEILPGLADHHCATGGPGGFVYRLHHGTYFGHVTEHVAIELSVLIGREVNFGRTVANLPGYDVVIECPVDEPPDCRIAEDLLQLAADIVLEIIEGSASPAIAERLVPIRERWENTRPGPTTAAIAAAARTRGLPVERMDDLSLLRIGHGKHRRLVWAALTDATSAIGVDIAGDKQLTRRMLADAAVPVPPGGLASTAEEALDIFRAVGEPAVVKPRHGHQGTQVHLGLRTPDMVRAAFQSIVSSGEREVIVERQFSGRDYRVLMVQGQVVAAAERIPAHVIGDGVSSISQLVAIANRDPRRGEGHNRSLTRLTIDDAQLRRIGYTSDAVPADGEPVWLRANANLSTGGTSRDVTPEVHPDVRDLCTRVAGLMGLDIAGIDLRLSDIAEPLPPDQPDAGTCGVIEVNAAPGLRMHLEPSEGAPRPVATAVMEALYPSGSTGRIPIVSIAGTNGKTTIARLTAHMLAQSGHRVGLTTTDGIYLNGRLAQKADATGPRSAQVVLGDPGIDCAVLETARGGLLRQGLGYDRSDVGVITNLSPDHLGQDGVDTMDDLVHVKALIAEKVRDGGTLVLNADDALVRDLIVRPRIRAAHKNLLWFSLDSKSPLVERHVENGGTAYVLSEGYLMERAGPVETRLLPVTDVPGGFAGAARFAAANALAAAAAARAMGLAASEIGPALGSFDAAAENPGRGQLFELGGVHLLVDYAHNPAAISAVAGLVEAIWGTEHAVAAVTLPGDRRDDLIADCARAVADGFHRVVLYEDSDLRGRAHGEVPEIVRSEIAARRPELVATTVMTAAEAVPVALAMANPGDVVVLMYEAIGPMLEVLDTLGARAVTQQRELARLRSVAHV
ncbi:cyanophycin synthetase [Virgisporangium aurantiacum]|uniref:Cyanophycin synthetase n=1 Tax=Virgisporangium aurantiacum TaxID=175570 RepID=A0A8J3ZIC8_9ACTN|nr:cyanophycin synthetase [Virgisporangium aurantiacum]GIJ61943.1 cyanophycin synthetase [Virgisporangium aurantiacum]